MGECWFVPDRFVIRLEEVEKVLLKIKLAKAMVPDCIPNWILKRLGMHSGTSYMFHL